MNIYFGYTFYNYCKRNQNINYKYTNIYVPFIYSYVFGLRCLFHPPESMFKLSKTTLP